MKKRVLAFLLAFALVMPMLAITALADPSAAAVSGAGTVQINYTDATQMTVLNVQYDATAVATDPAAQYSVQAYLTAAPIADPVARAAAGIDMANTTWIDQKAGADFTTADTFLLGTIPPAVAALNTLSGMFVSVWVNDQFIGADQIGIGGVPCTDVKFDPAWLAAGVKVNTSGPVGLLTTTVGGNPLLDPNVTVNSISTPVLIVTPGPWTYTALKSGTAFLQVFLNGTLQDTQYTRVLP